MMLQGVPAVLRDVAANPADGPRPRDRPVLPDIFRHIRDSGAKLPMPPACVIKLDRQGAGIIASGAWAASFARGMGSIGGV